MCVCTLVLDTVHLMAFGNKKKGVSVHTPAPQREKCESVYDIVNVKHETLLQMCHGKHSDEVLDLAVTLVFFFFNLQLKQLVHNFINTAIQIMYEIIFTILSF